jgi:N,N'-diacetyllegionaminate synthase
MSQIQIGNRALGENGDIFIIAEIGVNHDGRLDRALSLVESAATAGADAVKLQLFRADDLLHASASLAEYQKQNASPASIHDMLRRYELSDQNIATIINRARELGLAPLATPFSPGYVARIAKLDLPAIKIASPDLVNWPLLKRAAAVGKPLLISTGAATMAEIHTTVAWLGQWGVPFALLHCVSSYPTPAPQANLCWIAELADTFECPVGFSDHTTEPLAGALAVAAGAVIVEKHLTYDRAAAGPDHAASFDPKQFADYVRSIRQARSMLGLRGKRVLEIERQVRALSRQSMVAARDLKSGQILREEDVRVQRPGSGVSAALAPQLIGRPLRRDFRAGEMLTWTAISDAA